MCRHWYVYRNMSLFLAMVLHLGQDQHLVYDVVYVLDGILDNMDLDKNLGGRILGNSILDMVHSGMRSNGMDNGYMGNTMDRTMGRTKSDSISSCNKMCICCNMDTPKRILYPTTDSSNHSSLFQC